MSPYTRFLNWWHSNRFAYAYNNRCWRCLWDRHHREGDTA